MPQLVSLGPLSLPTLKGDVTETLGDQLETIGAGVVAGERRPRPLTLTIPVRGDLLPGVDRRAAGLRLRRQVRSLLDNATARMQGLYLNWSVDAELNGWLLVGGGDLKYGVGGISFGDFELELTDCYRVGNQRTHRAARRIVRLDRRLATTPRDILGTLYSTEFASIFAIGRHYLPIGAVDAVTGSTGAPAPLDGGYLSDSFVDGDVIHFEQAEADMNASNVQTYSSNGSDAKANWEPVYGPDHPIVGVPVMDNGVCQVVPSNVTGYVDVRQTDGTTVATITQNAGATGFQTRVGEWTTERAVLCMSSIQAAGVRGELYITLQRGWSGPRVEMYGFDGTGAFDAVLNVYDKTAGSATYQRSNTSAVSITTNAFVGSFVGIEPWVALLGPTPDAATGIAVLQQDVGMFTLVSGISGARRGLAFLSPTPYLSLSLAQFARATAAVDTGFFAQTNLVDARTIPELVGRS